MRQSPRLNAGRSTRTSSDRCVPAVLKHSLQHRGQFRQWEGIGMRFGRLSCIEEIADTIVLPILDSDNIDLISQAGDLLIPYMERLAFLYVVWIRPHEEPIRPAVVFLEPPLEG